jgi:GMP synthase (glutamine-hydrolysing)
MIIHFVQHEYFEAPGAYLQWADKKGFEIRFSKVYENQPLPSNIDDIDILIVMGGPQSPDTPQDECPHFDAVAEMNLIRAAVDGGKVVIGVCLGAQLIGQALGAMYEHSPQKEIGVFPIRLTEEGFMDSNISHFGSELQVGHWHSDMPGLTLDCKVLASSAGCPRQIVAYSNLVYGFQCHMEFNADVVERLIENEPIFSSVHNHLYVQSPEQIRRFDFSRMNELLFLFLDRVLVQYLAI